MPSPPSSLGVRSLPGRRMRPQQAEAMGTLARAGLLLLLALGLHQSQGLRYGIRVVDLKSKKTVMESGFVYRWTNSAVGSHPWQVSVKLGGHHFWGGRLIQDDWVVIAAHCMRDLHKRELEGLTVTAGEYNLFQRGEQEQNIPVSKVILHPKLNSQGYMSSDTALLYLKHNVKFASEYSNVLQEEPLPILDDRICNTVLKSMHLCPLGGTLLCIVFPQERKNACQRDSGGTLVCRRRGRTWALIGITSWVAGCARGSAPLRNDHRRAFPGIFSKVLELMDFITQHVIKVYKTQLVMLFGESSRISCPCSKEDDHSHNCFCIWKIMVPEHKIILIKLTRLGRRNQIRCDHCYVSLLSSSGVPVSKECRDILPSSLLTENNKDIFTFVFDAETHGSNFELSCTVIQNSEAGPVCGSVAILVENRTIHRDSYPYFCLSSIWCHWFMCAPQKHIIKLISEDFNEFDPNHIYDAVVLYDPKEEHDLDSLNKIGLASPLKTNTISTTKALPYDVCGIPPSSPQWLSRRIAGGEEACPHCWPWHVGLRFLGDHQCGGAIIHPVWILTAAHCVQVKGNPLSWTIVAGDHDRTLKEPTEQVRRAKHIIVHEDFDTVTYDSDIALIQLSSPLEYNSAVRPVCLPHGTKPLVPSELCVVTGWGSTGGDGGLASRLQQIQVPVLERAVCERTYYSAHPGGITDKMLCAGSAASAGKDFCQGDSGGPLVCRSKNGPFVLYGIVSWGTGCVQPWKPGVFARVRVFLDWIQSKTKGPASLQAKNKRKTLTKKLSPPTSSTDSVLGPGSTQGHMVTCKDVLAKPAGIVRIPRRSHRVIKRKWQTIDPSGFENTKHRINHQSPFLSKIQPSIKSYKKLAKMFKPLQLSP